MSKLTLYHLPLCPFCLKVRAVASALGIQLELVDISRDTTERQRLLDARGRATVPVLSIPEEGSDARLLGESKAIMQFLRTEGAAQWRVA